MFEDETDETPLRPEPVALLERIAGPPTPESAALLLDVNVSTLNPEQAHEVVLAAERLVRAAQAVQNEAMVVAVGPEPVPDPDTGRLPVDDDAEWLAVDLGGSRQFQLSRIDTARYLLRWLPRTCAAMRAGEWGSYQALQIVKAAQSLTRPELIGRLEERIVPRGTFDLARRLRRAVARLDPDAVEAKKRKARSGRSLQFFKDRYGDGTAGLSGTAPSSLMALIAAAIDLDARPRLDGDCRTIDMRRFDVLADWARQRLGLPAEDTEPGQPLSLDPAAAKAAAAALLAHVVVQQADAAGAPQADATPARPAAGAVPADATRSAEVAVSNDHPAADATGPAEVPVSDDHPPARPADPDGAAVSDGHPGPVPDLARSPLLHQAKRCTTCGRTGPPTIPISVTVSLDTLLGLSREPAELAGWGPLDPDSARELAADGTWRRWTCEPTTGHLLDVGATTYRPGDALARFIRARDRTCRFPNCNQPAVRCDLDHTEPFADGGPTTRANLCALCRRHHRLKHDTDATYRQEPDGRTTWKDPDGRTHTRPADQHHHATDWTDWDHNPDPQPEEVEPPEPEDQPCPF